METNSQGIQIIYIIDVRNARTSGQYPEGVMKVQDKQGYCLFLTIEGTDYYKATLEAVFYAQDIDGFWKEKRIAKGNIREFQIDEEGVVCYKDNKLDILLEQAKQKNHQQIETERKDKERRKLQAEAEERHNKLQEEKERHQAEILKQEENFKKALEGGVFQQDTQIKDAEGNRWVKCRFCGKFAKVSEFCSYGGQDQMNFGTCYECLKNNPKVQTRIEEQTVVPKIKANPDKCPECGGTLREKSGKFGDFMGCSNYPSCRYTRKIKRAGSGDTKRRC